ncbi:hypothetical protein COOONC_24361 [Cooperia oncophora]
MGLINRRRYWYVVDNVSPYFYWYKDHDSLKCDGRIPLACMALTYDPRETGRFHILSGNDNFLLECSSNRVRDEWMQVLQAARLRSVRGLKEDGVVHAKDDVETTFDAPSSTFYLTTNGELNEHSMAMPKPVVSPEAVIGRILEKTNEHLVAPKRALEGVRRSIRLKKDCEVCKQVGFC